MKDFIRKLFKLEGYESNHLKSNRRSIVLSFKNLTVEEKKVHKYYNLILLERRLGYETGVTNEVSGDGLSTVSKILKGIKG